MKPRVLAVSFFSSPGAVADNSYTLARSLAGQTELSLLTSSLLATRPIEGVRESLFVDFPKERPLTWLSPAQWVRIIRFARAREHDLLFLYSEHPLHAVVERMARARRTLFWCLDPAPHSGSRQLAATIYEMAKRSLMRRADRVVVACERLHADVVKRYGVPPERVLTSFHGVLDNMVFPDIQPGERDIDILFFGRRERYKGLDVLLEAVQLLSVRPNGHAARVVIAGPGTEPVPATPGVTVEMRYVPDRELAGMIARAKVVAMPYRDATGSQVPQTAFVYGTPVVATAVGCLPAYVTDGVNGLVVPRENARALASALDRVLGDQELWNRLSTGARRTVTTVFDNQALAARLLADALAD